MKFVFASDSFKGTLSSAEIGAMLCESARAAFPGCDCRSVTMADGGEGSVAAVLSAAGGRTVPVRAHDPLGGAVDAFYGVTDGGCAVIETAAASGLTLIDEARRDIRAASSYGTGELIAHALDAGYADITLALGGSATNDGGAGAMAALGARFLDADGRTLAPNGASLRRIASIDLSHMHPRLAHARFTAMCDVNSPLTGPLGATMTYGPQKGASTPALLGELEAGMENYARVLRRAFPGRDVEFPGAGAAGGLGAACALFLGAALKPGAEAVLDLTGFDTLLRGADLAVTGEGRADAQSVRGKAVAAVAARCKKAGVPLIALVGSAGPGADALLGCGVTKLLEVTPDGCPPPDRAAALYRAAADRFFCALAAEKRR